MAVSVKLRPSPQFDRSLVDYMVANFIEIKTALLHVQGRIDIWRDWAQGPYRVNIPVSVPFRCDVYMYSRTVFYNLGVGMSGPIPLWDNVAVGSQHDMYTNEANSYKQTTGVEVIKNVDAGIHTYSLELAFNMGRHANDRIGYAPIFYALF